MPVAAATHFRAFRRSAGGARLEFDAINVDLGVINAVRRVIIADVPTAAFRFDPTSPAINGVVIKSNNTALHNEIVGQRVGLVPINFDPNALRVFDPNQWRFVLRVKNQGGAPRVVTTKDFEVFDQSGARHPPATHAALFPADPVTRDHVLLLLLKPSTNGSGNGEEIHLECTASLGTGREHARWSPASLCFFRNKPDPVAAAAALEARVAQARTEGASDAEVDALREDWVHLGAHRHFVTNAYGEPAAFEFVLETEVPRLTPEYLVYKGLRVLHDRVAALAGELRRGPVHDPGPTPDGAEGGAAELAAARVRVRAVPYVDDFYEAELAGEDHTLGNLVQSVLYRRWVRDGGGEDVSFIGYFQPHPLEDRVVIKLKCTRPRDDVHARLADGMEHVAALLLQLCLEWIEASGLGGQDVVEVRELVRTRGRGSVAARLKGRP